MAIRSAFRRPLRPWLDGEVLENKDVNVKKNMAQQSKQQQIENEIKNKVPLFKKARKNQETVQVEGYHTQDGIQAGKHNSHFEIQEINGHNHLEYNNQDPETDLKNIG